MTLSKEQQIEYLLSKQTIPVIHKTEEYQCLTQSILDRFGVKQDSEFYRLYSKYFLMHLDCSDYASELEDPCPNGFRAAEMAHEYWFVPKNYILFSSGVGEGGYLYNTEDHTVWDFDLGIKELLGTPDMPHWDSFYDFMIWYLTIDEAQD